LEAEALVFAAPAVAVGIGVAAVVATAIAAAVPAAAAVTAVVPAAVAAVVTGNTVVRLIIPSVPRWRKRMAVVRRRFWRPLAAARRAIPVVAQD
jgi:hypothetical protein